MKQLIFIVTLVTLFIVACKKTKPDPHVPPSTRFKTGPNYVSDNITTSTNDTIVVGLIAEKTEDDLKNYNVSYRYDGATNSTTFFNYQLSASENSYYEHDITLVTRSQTGTETWLFTILDRDGNIAQKTITVTVQ